MHNYEVQKARESVTSNPPVQLIYPNPPTYF